MPYYSETKDHSRKRIIERGEPKGSFVRRMPSDRKNLLKMNRGEPYREVITLTDGRLVVDGEKTLVTVIR